MKSFFINPFKVVLVFLMAICLGNQAYAAVNSASGSASTSTLSTTQNNNVTVTWRFNVDGTGVLSNQATIANVNPPLVVGGIQSLPGTSFTETFNFSAAQVQAWRDQNYRVIVLRRDFADLTLPGPTVNVDVRFSIVTPSNSLKSVREDAEFSIQRLQLSFPNQTSLIVVEPGSSLAANLDVNYSGTGILEGRWQIAEPGSSEGLPLYRNLKLEKRSLTKAQHTRIVSPALPTGKPGKYLLRFCVIDRSQTDLSSTNDFNCPNEQLKVEAAYQVMADKKKVDEIKASSSSKVDKESEFKWSGVTGAVVYQLQVFDKVAEQEPVFVTGMLLPQTPLKTTLSDLVINKLHAGKVYQWRINALNSQGQLIGQSAMQQFAFSP